MMDLVTDSVKRLMEVLQNSGCEDGGVRLDVDPDSGNCPYERGALMTASFGGRSAVYATHDPIRALTRISFMKDAPLDTPATRSAACAIINVATGFVCISRVLHPCQKASYGPCRSELEKILAGKSVFCIGSAPAGISFHSADSPAAADILLIGADGLIADGTGDTVEKHREGKQILCTGPSTAGTARLQHLEHFCPYGTY